MTREQEITYLRTKVDGYVAAVERLTADCEKWASRWATTNILLVKYRRRETVVALGCFALGALCGWLWFG